ncbi:aminotransferase [Streptomyces sp. AA4]|nr:aminotransferase [Streptomyces sp. AA4]
MSMPQHSATLAINDRIQERRAAGGKVVHLGFGEAGLPVLPEIAAVLAGSATANSYAPVAGTPQARAAAAGYLTRRRQPSTPDHVVFAPGSKPLLYALLAAISGDVVLPQPAWVSYAAQAALAGKAVIQVPVPPGGGGLPDPDRLPAALDQARAAGRSPGVMVLTVPDNPTGRLPSREQLAEVTRIARDNGLVVISDEIYRDLTSEPFTSPAELLPERTIVTTGLSKNLALGGYRIGFARIPDSSLREAVIGIASEVWSGLAAPMQHVAAYALDEPAPVTAHIQAARRLHAAVSGAVQALFQEAGAACPGSQGPFYLYPDFEVLRPRVTTGADLASLLLERFGVAVLPGVEFGDDPAALRFRAATSLLYGDTDTERWAALRAPDPLRLPWIQESLTQLREAFQDLHSIAAPTRG